MKILYILSLCNLYLYNNTYGLQTNLEKVNDILQKQDSYGFFEKIYKNFFHLLPAIHKLENEIILNSTLGGNSHFLNKVLKMVNVEYIVDLKAELSYYETIWEEIKLQIATNWLNRILGRIVSYIGIDIRKADIYKKIEKKNYKNKKLIIFDKTKSIFQKMYFTLSLKNRQKLVYIVGKPGTGKTTLILDDLVKNGYIVYYINGNSILLSDHDEGTIIQALDEIKNNIMSISSEKRDKVVVVFDECEVAIKDVDQIRESFEKIKDNKSIISQITKNQIQKERALTSFMLYMLSLNGLSVVCISNSLNVSKYLSRRITYLEKFDLANIEDYIRTWRIFLQNGRISFEEGKLEDVIYIICLFSLEKKVSYRTISKFVMLYQNKKISLKNLFAFCTKRDE